MSDFPSLPVSLAERISDAQSQGLAEAPRNQRVKLLASALGLDEPKALAALASACGLGIASNLEADPESLGLLPARLVHDYQLVPNVLLPPPAPSSQLQAPSSQLPAPSSQLRAPNSTSPPPGHPTPSWPTGFVPTPLARWSGT